MRRVFLLLLLAAAVADAGLGQQKPGECERGPTGPRNWELQGREYVYFDYVLCPANLQPARPEVSIWITTRGNGILLERATPDRDGADSVSVFYGEKKAYTIYRDLAAVPFKFLNAERRATIASDISSQPFLLEGSMLILNQNLPPDSAERVKKVFENADVLIKKARAKAVLLRESSRISTIVEALFDRPLKTQT